MTPAILEAPPARMPGLDEVIADQCRRRLRRFIREAWPIVEPATPYSHNWHIDALCDHLEGVTAGEIQQLLITIPPRFMKSLTVAVFWPVWEWIEHPSLRYLFVSHSSGLAMRDALRSRRIIDSMGGSDDPDATLIQRVGYQGLLELVGQSWQLTTDQNVKHRYENDETGIRIATSIGGGATGEGGDRVVIDDPHKLEEAESETVREDAVEFVREVSPSRLNNAGAARVVIQQRVHESDAAGELLANERGEWTVLCLPNEYEPKHPFAWPEDPRIEPGELLWPERMGPAKTKQRRRELGSYKYAGQYQQRPAAAEGGILKRPWWGSYEPYKWPQLQAVVQSWDCAFKGTDDSDFVVGQAWGVDLANRYLLAQIRARLDIVDTVDAVRALSGWLIAQGFTSSHGKLVEAKANGPAVIRLLKREVPGLIPVEVGQTDGDKVARARAIAPIVEAGNVYLPRGAIPCPIDSAVTNPDRPEIDEPRWSPTTTEEFIDEAATFPNAAHDDQVDATSQALTRLAGKKRRRRKPKTGGYGARRTQDR